MGEFRRENRCFYHLLSLISRFQCLSFSISHFSLKKVIREDSFVGFICTYVSRSAFAICADLAWMNDVARKKKNKTSEKPSTCSLMTVGFHLERNRDISP